MKELLVGQLRLCTGPTPASNCSMDPWYEAGAPVKLAARLAEQELIIHRQNERIAALERAILELQSRVP